MFRRLGFTLVELLVVVALVAIIGAGVAVTYGHDIVDRAKRQMTMHEMGQIRDAFQKFYADNERQLFTGVYEAGRTSHREKLPSADFRRTFSGNARDEIEDSKCYGMLEFFERYGLWCLIRPAAPGEDWRDRFNEFKSYDPAEGEGWQGPYLRSDSVKLYTETSGELVPVGERTSSRAFRIPQLGTRYDNGIYRIVYFEHCEDDTDKDKPIYRRLLLLCSSSEKSISTHQELLRYAGNRRRRPRDVDFDSAFPINPETGAIYPFDAEHGVFIVELLNLDTWER